MRVYFTILVPVCTLLLCLLLAGRRKDKSLPEIFFVSVSGVFVWMAAAALGLTVIGEYSLRNLDRILAATAVLLVLVLLFARTAGRRKEAAGNAYRISGGRKRPAPRHAWIFLLCLAALFLYASYTTEYLIGGRDPGVYAIQGAYINRNGGLYIHDDYISENYGKLEKVIRVGYPGFYSALEYGVSSDPGRIVPQFLPMFPSVLAVGYSVAGLAGGLKSNAFLAVLSLLAFYAFAKGLIGKKGAALATLLLAINPSQIWNARITQTEILSQFLFFSALAAFTDAYRRNDGKAAAVSGILLGIGCFNRIDSYIFGLGIYICTAYILLVDRKKSRLYLHASFWYSVFMGLSVLYGYFFRHPYYSFLWKDGSLKALLLMNGVFFLLIPLAMLIRLLVVNRWPDRFRPLLFRFLEWKRRKLPQWAVFILFVLFLFAYFIRPLYFTGGFEVGTEGYFKAHSLVEFGFYIPQIAMLFALLGLYHILRDKGIHPYLIFLSIAVASILIYTYRPSITPDHPWASRRWITVNIPAVLLMAVYGIQRIRTREKRLNRWIKVAATGMILVFLLSQSGIFLFQSMLKGYGEQFAEAAEAIPEDGLVLTDNVQLASPLTYINGKKVYLLKEEGFSDAAADFIRGEGSVYGIGWPNYRQVDSLFRKEISVSVLSGHKLTGLYPEESRGHYPEKIVRRDYDAGIRRLDYSPENLYYTYRLTTDFLTQNGKPEGESMVSDGRAGFLLFGNYTALSAGTYELSFSGSLPEDLPDDTDANGTDANGTGANDTDANGTDANDTDANDTDANGTGAGETAGKEGASDTGMTFPGNAVPVDRKTGFLDVVYNQGGRELVVRNLTEFARGGTLEGAVSFTLEQGASDLEFRIFAGQNIPLKVDKMVLRKLK